MGTYIGSEPNWIDKIGFAGIVLAVGLLFVALMQPVWRGEEMKNNFVSDCEKRGGVLLIHKTMLGGTSYECASRLDR